MTMLLMSKAFSIRRFLASLRSRSIPASPDRPMSDPALLPRLFEDCWPLVPCRLLPLTRARFRMPPPDVAPVAPYTPFLLRILRGSRRPLQSCAFCAVVVDPAGAAVAPRPSCFCSYLLLILFSMAVETLLGILLLYFLGLSFAACGFVLAPYCAILFAFHDD